MDYIQFITYHPEYNLSYANLSDNPNITWEYIQLTPYKMWNCNKLSKNPNITWDIVRLNPDKPWLVFVLTFLTMIPIIGTSLTT